VHRRGPRQRAASAKVSQLQLLAEAQQIGRSDIAMDQPSGMHVRERDQHFADALQGSHRMVDPSAFAQIAHLIRQRSSMSQLKDKERAWGIEVPRHQTHDSVASGALPAIELLRQLVCV
jgi:hypothetical protein